MQRAAIETRVLEDLRWMSARAERVLVVAHSQGAAITHSILKDLQPNERPNTYVSFGSGLKQLTEIESVQGSGRRWRPLVPSIGLLILGAAMPGVYQLLAGGGSTSANPFDLLFMTSAATLVMIVVQTALAARGRSVPIVLSHVVVVATLPFLLPPDTRALGWLVLLGVALIVHGSGLLKPEDISEDRYQLSQDIKWLDFYSTHDPVSNGALRDEPSDHYMLSSVEVRNFASIMRDHTTYWRNCEGFVVPLASLAVSEAGLGTEDPRSTGARIEAAGYRRRWRVRWLAWSRGLGWLSASGLIVLGWDSELPSIGQRVWDSLQAVEWVASIFSIVPFVERNSLETDITTGVARLIGVSAVLLVVFLVYRILHAAWRAWEWSDRRAFLAHVQFKPLSPAMATFFGLLLVVSFMAVLVVAAFRSDVDSRLAVVVAVGLLSIGLLLALVVSFSRWRDWTRSGAATAVLETRAKHLLDQLAVTRDLKQLRGLVWRRVFYDPAGFLVSLPGWRRLDRAASLLSQEAYLLAQVLGGGTGRNLLLQAAPHWTPAAVVYSDMLAVEGDFAGARATLSGVQAPPQSHTFSRLAVALSRVAELEAVSRT
jgi:hypothetical protein